MEECIFDITLKIRSQKKLTMTTQVNDSVLTFVVKLHGLKTKNKILNKLPPLNKNEKN